MKYIILLILLLTSVEVASAHQWICDYGNGVIKNVNLYQCPPTLKIFYKLQKQTNSSEIALPYTPTGGGGGAYYGSINPEEVMLYNTSCIHQCDKCYNRNSSRSNELYNWCMWDSQKDTSRKWEAIIKFGFVMLAITIGLYCTWRILWRKKDGTKKTY